MRYQTMDVEQKKKLDSVLRQNIRSTDPIQRNTASPLQAGFLAAQAGLGNRYVQRIVDSARKGSAALPIQAKLLVGSAQDAYEREADRVAEQVMSMPEITPKVQRMVEEEDEEKIQTKPLAATITPLVQRAVAPDDSFESGADFESRLATTRGGGRPLPNQTREFMEQRFGVNFSGVRVHTGWEAAQLNRLVRAQAFTLGQDIYLGEGKTDLEATQDKRLLAHELTHVLQQMQNLHAPDLAQTAALDTPDRGVTQASAFLGAAIGFFVEGKHLDFLSSGVDQVIQRSKLYDNVEDGVKQAFDCDDFEASSVTDERIINATKELIAEYLSDLAYCADVKGTQLLVPAKWEVYLNEKWQGGWGTLGLPPRKPTMNNIFTHEFKPNLGHELGHAVKASQAVPQWQAVILEMAKDSRCNPAQSEELRADMTGVSLRWLNGDKPKVEDYKHLKDEHEDAEHPAGALRLEKITEVIEVCDKVDAWRKAVEGK